MVKKYLFYIGFMTMLGFLLIPDLTFAADLDTSNIKYYSLIEYQVKTVVGKTAGIFLALSILIIVYVGFMYITGGDNPVKIEKAKTRLLKTGLGIAVTLSIFGVLRIFESIFNI